jgi:UDP-N-acetylenolpyruvoylglucosamine reductase
MKDWRSDLSSFDGKIVAPEHADYSKYCTAFNGHFQKRPQCVLFPKNEQDVSLALQIAQSNSIKVSVFNGGHSTTSSGLNTNGVVLHMREMSSIDVDADAQYIQVGAGCLAHQIDQATFPFGKAIPLGDCPVVGICGLTLGGGIGFLSRAVGLTVDHLVEVQLVTLSGEIKTCSDHENTDLFYLLRGAGQGNFGVVTKLKFRLVDVPNSVYGGNICWPLAEAKSILTRYEQLMKSAPRALNLYCRINEELGPMVKVYGMFYGDPSEGEKLFNHIRSWSTPIYDNAQIYSYLDMQRINESTIVDSPSFLWKNSFLDGEMSQEFIEEVIQHYENRPTPYCRINIDTVDGAVHDYSDYGVFPHRNSNYIVSVMGVWFDAKDKNNAVAWAKNTMNKLMPFLNGQVYVNYADPNAALEPHRYYGGNAEAVRTMKQKYDSKNVIIGTLNPESVTF